MTSPDPLDGLTVTTPWYPTLHNPVTGSFVTDWTGLAGSLTRRIGIVHAEEWPGGTPDAVARVSADADRVLTRMSSRGELDTPGRWATLTRVPTIISAGFDVADRAEAAVESTRAYGGALDTPVVHGHVGYLGGLTAARLADPAARVIATEHSSGLGDFLATARGRELYTEVLERAHRLTCVSAVVRDLILAHCPGFEDTVMVVPNPVEFQPPHQRSDRPTTLDRWVFAGSLTENKGVIRLLEAFARFAADRPDATLDFYGGGPLDGRLADLARSAGIAERVFLHGKVTHDELLAALPRHDVLLAPSHYETFHLVVSEAIAAGIPVVVTRSGGPQEALAGVEHLVGRFVDVNDDPDELVDAVRDLEAGIEAVDLPAARAALAARYGTEAVRSTLAGLYGCADPQLDTSLAPATPAVREHVVVSVSGWRKYAVASFLESLSAAGAPTTLLSADAELLGLHPGVPSMSPAAHLSSLRAGSSAGSRPSLDALNVSVRGTIRDPKSVLRGARRRAADARSLVRGLAGRGAAPTAPVAASEPVEQDPTPTAAHGIGPDPTYVVADVASFPTVAALLAARPEARLAIEPDRRALGLSPVDAP